MLPNHRNDGCHNVDAGDYDCVAVVRHRSERARREVLETTADLLAEVGVERVTIDEVAARSGVAKTTIYRHWPSKQALVAEAVHGCMAPIPTPNTGDLRQDLYRCFEGMVASSLSGRVGSMYPSLLDNAQRDPELNRIMSEYQHERREPIITVLQLAQARGELTSDLDLELAATLLIGPLKYQRLVLQDRVTEDFLRAVIDGVLTGLQHAAITTSS